VPGRGWSDADAIAGEDADLDGLDAEFGEGEDADAAPLAANDRVGSAVAHAAE
jgi:hypothetical protein